jgi:hypothetical protein
VTASRYKLVLRQSLRHTTKQATVSSASIPASIASAAMTCSYAFGELADALKFAIWMLKMRGSFV